MNNFIPGVITGFREGLEAFLVVVIILRFLGKSQETLLLKKNVKYGIGVGVLVSLIIGGILYLISNSIGNMDEVAELWESGASFVALALVTTFIIWMIKHGSNMTQKVENDTAKNLSPLGIVLFSAVMIAREGVEVAIFTYAGEYSINAILLGILTALVLTVLIYYSLVKVNIKTIFNVTLAYLILQAGFLLGYGIHEGLELFTNVLSIPENSFLVTKAFDLSGTILGHKEGVLGIPLYVLFGWYSKPEWIQFIAQYAYTITMFLTWIKIRSKNKKVED